MKAVALDILTGEEIALSPTQHVVFGAGDERITVMVRDECVEISAEHTLVVLPRSSNQILVGSRR